MPIDGRKIRPRDAAGKEIFEIKPVMLGGSATDPANKTLLTREQHIDAVRYWNGVVRDLKDARRRR